MATIGNGKHIIFANGGDRQQGNVTSMIHHDKIEFAYGVGGEHKMNQWHRF